MWYGDSRLFQRCQHFRLRKISVEESFPFYPVCKAVSEFMHAASSGRVDWNIWTIPLNQFRCRSSIIDCPTKNTIRTILIHFYCPADSVIETDLGNNSVCPHFKVYGVQDGGRIATRRGFVNDEYNFGFQLS